MKYRLDLWVWFAAYSWVDTPTMAILMDKNTWDSTQALERETHRNTILHRGFSPPFRRVFP